MSPRTPKLNSALSRTSGILKRGMGRAGRGMLLRSAAFLTVLSSRIKRLLLITGIILMGMTLSGIIILFAYYGSGEDGGETGIVDISMDNAGRSTISESYGEGTDSRREDMETPEKKDATEDAGISSGASPEASDGDDVAEFALRYVGNPYVWGGTSLTEGCDCSGFTMKVMENFGISLPHHAHSQRSLGTEVSEEELSPGDLVFYDAPDHVAIYIGGGQIVEASSPRDGIRINSYDHRTVAYCARYITPGKDIHTLSSSEEEAGGEGTTSNHSLRTNETRFRDITSNYSPSNRAYFNFFLDVSKNKSVYQIKKDEETGEDVLITPDDPDAVSDYFKNDEKYYISPFLLYSMNSHIWGNTFAYPEAFLNPVAHDGDYNLLDISEDNLLTVSSVIRRSTGEETGDRRYSVSDYGLASILKYREEDMVDKYMGTYIKEDYYDYTTAEVKQREINETYSYEISREKRHVLEWAQTFAGYVTYDYIPSTTKTGGLRSGVSENPRSDLDTIYYKTEEVPVYIIVPISSSDRTSNQVWTTSSLESAKKYINSHPGYTLYGAEYDKEGEITGGKTTVKRYKLYKYRGSDSGRYTDFVQQSSINTVEQTNDYLDDYLGHFSTYKPVTIDRDPEVFGQFITSSDSYPIRQTSSADTGSAIPGDSFDDYYSDDEKREIIETIWDTALAYGFSEQQAAAIIGNIKTESAGFQPDATHTDSDGEWSYGLCQWRDSRKTRLWDFASEYYGEDVTDSKCSVQSQISFAMMELDTSSSYSWTPSGWSTSGNLGPYSHAENYAAWQTSGDINTLTLAMCFSWERPDVARSGIEGRQSFANAAFERLQGKSFGMAAEVISTGTGEEPSVSLPSLSRNTPLTDAERDIYHSFYHAADDIYSSDNTFRYFEYGLTKEQRDDVLLTASALSKGITKRAARLDLGEELWEEDFVLNATDLSELKTYSTNIGSVNLAEAAGFMDYDFLWPFARDATSGGGLWLDGSKFSSRFGTRGIPTAGATSDHKGLDIPVDSGTPVFSVTAGTVTFVGVSGTAGYSVMIDHGANKDGEEVESRYYHLEMDSAIVSVGDTVEKGQQIARSDNTGASTGPHLHLSITVNGLYYNPLAFYDISCVPMLSEAGGEVVETDLGSVGSLPSGFNSLYYESLYYDGGGFSSWD